MLSSLFSSSESVSELEAILAVAGRHQQTNCSELFGAALAAAAGVSHGLAVSSDTAAVSTLIGAIGLRPGDSVLVAAHLRTRFVFPLFFGGLVPVFVDCLRTDLSLDAEAIAAAAALERMRVAFLAAPWGVAQDLAPIRNALAPLGCRIVLDVTDCLSPGLARSGLVSGAEIALLSLTEGESPLSTGEGGALLSDDAALVADALSYQRFADLLGERPGINQKISAMQAALGLHKLNRLQIIGPEADVLRRKLGAAGAEEAQDAFFGTHLILRRTVDLPGVALRFLPRAHSLAVAARRAQSCPRLDTLAASLCAVPVSAAEQCHV